MAKIRCTHHEGDDTPSLEIYPDGSQYCFACSYYAKPTAKGNLIEVPRYVENIKESLEKIRKLPVIAARGLNLHSDGEFYYIVWNNADYYIKRKIVDNKIGSKYHSPAGHKKPMFIAQEGPVTDSLIVVEGQLNALSLAQAGISGTIVSPGAATDFTKISNLPYYKPYSSVVVIVDEDPAGVKAGIDLKSTLISWDRNTKVGIFLAEKGQDANDVLQKTGKKGIQSWIKKVFDEVGMPEKMRYIENNL